MTRLNLVLMFFLAIGFSAIAIAVNPDSLDIALSQLSGDSALSARAELAYARGLYQTTAELAERIENPTQADLLLLGLCNHILAKPYAAKGYFAQITDSEYVPLAMLGLAELYCGDIADAESCARYIELVEKMEYLGRFVELRMPNGTITADTNIVDEAAGQWTLQFGAFAMRSLAERMATKVKQEGLPVLIVPQEREGDTLYFVYGGSFLTKGEAAAQADAMAKEFVCEVVEMPE